MRTWKQLCHVCFGLGVSQCWEGAGCIRRKRKKTRWLSSTAGGEEGLKRDGGGWQGPGHAGPCRPWQGVWLYPKGKVKPLNGVKCHWSGEHFSTSGVSIIRYAFWKYHSGDCVEKWVGKGGELGPEGMLQAGDNRAKTKGRWTGHLLLLGHCLVSIPWQLLYPLCYLK